MSAKCVLREGIIRLKIETRHIVLDRWFSIPERKLIHQYISNFQSIGFYPFSHQVSLEHMLTVLPSGMDRLLRESSANLQ